MIERLDYRPTLISCNEQIIIEKLNEVIDVVNSRASFMDKVFGGENTELAKAAKKAATTGNHKDLQEYLRLQRER